MKVLLFLCVLALLAFGAYQLLFPPAAAVKLIPPPEVAETPPPSPSASVPTATPKPTPLQIPAAFLGTYIGDRRANLQTVKDGSATLSLAQKTKIIDAVNMEGTLDIRPDGIHASPHLAALFGKVVTSATERVVVLQTVDPRNKEIIRSTIKLQDSGIVITFSYLPGAQLVYLRKP